MARRRDHIADLNFSKRKKTMEGSNSGASPASSSSDGKRLYGLAGLRERLISIKESTDSKRTSEVSSPKILITPSVADKAT